MNKRIAGASGFGGYVEKIREYRLPFQEVYWKITGLIEEQDLIELDRNNDCGWIKTRRRIGLHRYGEINFRINEKGDTTQVNIEHRFPMFFLYYSYQRHLTEIPKKPEKLVDSLFNSLERLLGVQAVDMEADKPKLNIYPRTEPAPPEA